MNRLLQMNDNQIPLAGETSFGFSLSESNYFSALPVFVQETIMQENANIQNEEELRNIAENILNKKMF